MIVCSAKLGRKHVVSCESFKIKASSFHYLNTFICGLEAVENVLFTYIK